MCLKKFIIIVNLKYKYINFSVDGWYIIEMFSKTHPSLVEIINMHKHLNSFILNLNYWENKQTFKTKIFKGDHKYQTFLEVKNRLVPHDGQEIISGARKKINYILGRGKQNKNNCGLWYQLCSWLLWALVIFNPKNVLNLEHGSICQWS